ncbi:MAG: 6-carboxytetrahydropterin synthase [Deltaproteobacteria bacterium]|nr:6-carboxytetrahydropterin synthase [Deltaproteobacteria bacterium]
MPKYTITKRLDFCYGHRLLNYDGKCRHLHGHNALMEIDITAEALDEKGMACDFSEIKQKLKTWIDLNLDHRMLLNKKDPMVTLLKEVNEPLFLMKENPTAENIAKLLFEEASKMGFQVESVRLWETPNSCATYRRNNG